MSELKKASLKADQNNQLNDTTDQKVLSMLSTEPQRGMAISRRLGYKTTREFRRSVSNLRKKGEPICTKPTGGYFLGNPKEVEIEIRKLRHRAIDLLESANGMEGYDPDQVKWEDI